MSSNKKARRSIFLTQPSSQELGHSRLWIQNQSGFRTKCSLTKLCFFMSQSFPAPLLNFWFWFSIGLKRVRLTNHHGGVAASARERGGICQGRCTPLLLASTAVRYSDMHCVVFVVRGKVLDRWRWETMPAADTLWLMPSPEKALAKSLISLRIWIVQVLVHHLEQV